MKIGILGDVHLQFQDVHKIMKAYPLVDMYLQVGDLADYDVEYPSFPKPLYFIAGNHDNFGKLEIYEQYRLGAVGKVNKNLYYIPRGNFVQLYAPDKNGECKFVTVVGLGGNYASSRYEKERWQLSGNRRRHYVKSDVERIKEWYGNPENIDILLTHEAPSPYYHSYDLEKDRGRPEITELVKILKPKYHFFGHHHYYTKSGRCFR
jgi:hypothetical protein